MTAAATVVQIFLSSFFNTSACFLRSLKTYLKFMQFLSAFSYADILTQ